MTSIKHITIEATIPEGIPIGDLSRQYPEATFNLTNGHWVKKDERIIYITCKEWDNQYYYYLDRHKGVIKTERVGNVIMVHIKTQVLRSLEQKDMTIIYPTTLKGGKHTIDFLINDKQLTALKKNLPECMFLKISDSYKPRFQLTERQKDIITRAYSLGYFEYPRRVTLTELAKLFKVSKATLSQTLRTVENKAIQEMINQRW